MSSLDYNTILEKTWVMLLEVSIFEGLIRILKPDEAALNTVVPRPVATCYSYFVESDR